MLLIRLSAFRKLCQSELLNWLPWSEDHHLLPGLRRQTAINNASMARSLHIRGFIDQPITWRETDPAPPPGTTSPQYGDAVTQTLFGSLT